MGIRDLYEVELESEFKELEGLDPGSEEHKRTVSDISQLTDRLVRLRELENEKERIEIERNKMMTDNSKVDIEKERNEIDRKKMEEDKKNRLIDHAINTLGIIVPAGITITGMVLMFIFEEKGPSGCRVFRSCSRGRWRCRRGA